MINRTNLALLIGLCWIAPAFGGEIPDLAMPVDSALPHAAGKISAQAEVSAIKSPVKLTLSVYKTTLKLKDEYKTIVDWERLENEHPEDANGKTDWAHIDKSKYMHQERIQVGEPLWIKIRLTNIGKKTMFVMDDLFTGPKDFSQALEEAGYSGVSVIITKPDGKKVQWKKSGEVFAVFCPEDDPASPYYHQRVAPLAPAGRAEIDAWKKAGYSTEKINQLLDAEDAEKRKTKDARENAHHPIKQLQPGESIATGAWRYRGKCEGDSAKYPQQIGDYAELWGYHLDSPGVYEISADYFSDPFARSHGKKIQLTTPPIQITVQP